MPASRTRKKTQDKKKKEASAKEKKARLMRILGASLDKVPACNDCRGERVSVALDDVPETHRSGIDNVCEQLKQSGMKVREIVYCKKCDQYSAFSDWEGF